MNLVQIAQHADDLERAADFYERLLGEKPIATFDPPGLVFFRIGPTRLLLGRPRLPFSTSASRTYGHVLTSSPLKASPSTLRPT